MIDVDAFSNCRALTGVVIPDGVTRIRTWAFKNCESMVSATIPDSVTEMEDEIFDGCPDLTVVASQGSAAQIYCAENGIRCEAPDAEG